jgi:hypothetical protein
LPEKQHRTYGWWFQKQLADCRDLLQAELETELLWKFENNKQSQCLGGKWPQVVIVEKEMV